MLMILLVAIFYLGYHGWTKSVVVTSGSCSATYTRYTIKPFINNWWSCWSTTPCGEDFTVAKHNANVHVLQCLCKQTPRPDAAIQVLYSTTPLTQSSIDVRFICTTEAIEAGRV